MNQLENAEVFFQNSKKKLVRKSTHDLFAKKDILICGVNGAYVPTDVQQVKDFEKAYDDITACGVDEIYFVSMNDDYVMSAWWKSLKIKKCKYLPDGSGAFTLRLNNQGGMSGGLTVCEMYNKGMGKRSWRYLLLLEDNCQMSYVEEETPEGTANRDNLEEDPYTLTTPDACIKWLNGRQQKARIDASNDHSNDPARPV